MQACLVQVSSGGYINLPESVRKDLYIQDGDTLQLKVVNGEIHLDTRRHHVRNAQNIFRQYIAADTCLSEELIQERRNEHLKDE